MKPIIIQYYVFHDGSVHRKCNRKVILEWDKCIRGVDDNTKIYKLKQATCKNCGFTGCLSTINRFHNDRCKREYLK